MSDRAATVGRKKLWRYLSFAVLGDQLDQSPLQGGLDQLARAEVHLAVDAESASLERLGVELGQGLALGEVERRDGDRIVAERRGHRGTAIAGAGDKEHQDRGRYR
ncbi:MAG: hypothetical protein ACRDH7_01935 [Actinomycetota bacterium]